MISCIAYVERTDDFCASTRLLLPAENDFFVRGVAERLSLGSSTGRTSRASTSSTSSRGDIPVDYMNAKDKALLAAAEAKAAAIIAKAQLTLKVDG